MVMVMLMMMMMMSMTSSRGLIMLYFFSRVYAVVVVVQTVRVRVIMPILIPPEGSFTWKSMLTTLTVRTELVFNHLMQLTA